MLVKKPGKSRGAKLYYNDIGDYLKREEKLDILDSSSLGTTKWRIIKPNTYGDWINQRSLVFPSLRSLAPQEGEVNGMAPVFLSESVGLVSRRDAWVWNSSDEELRATITRNVGFYQKTLEKFSKVEVSGKQKERIEKARQFVGETPRDFHWNADSYRDLVNGKAYEVDDRGFTVGMYRPFFKQRLYFNSQLNSRTGKFPEIFPEVTSENLGIAHDCYWERTSPSMRLMTDSIADESP